MKNKVGDMEIGENDLVQKPRNVGKRKKECGSNASARWGSGEQEIGREVGDESAGDNAQRKMKRVEFSREQDPYGKEDEKCKDIAGARGVWGLWSSRTQFARTRISSAPFGLVVQQ